MKREFRFPPKKARILHALTLAISVLAIGAPIVLYAQALNLGIAGEVFGPSMVFLYILVLLLVLLTQIFVRTFTHSVLGADEEGIHIRSPFRARRIAWGEITNVRLSRRRRDFLVLVKGRSGSLSFYTYMQPVRLEHDAVEAEVPSGHKPSDSRNPPLADLLEDLHRRAPEAHWRGIPLDAAADRLRHGK